MQPIANPKLIYTKKVKARKEGREEANSWHNDVYRGIGRQMPRLVHVVEAPATKSLPRHLDLPQRQYHQGLPKFSVTLVPFSTKEFLHEGWRSPRPPHKVVDAAPHQAEVEDMPASHQNSKETSASR